MKNLFGLLALALLASAEVLADIAERVGMGRRETLEYLDGEQGISVVRAVEHQLRKAGIVAVPNIVLNGRVTVAGAQDPATIVSAIDEALFTRETGPGFSDKVH